MRIGITARVDCFGKVIPGDTVNYMEHLFNDFRKRHQVIVFDWKDLNSDLVTKGLVGNFKGVKNKETINLEKECDLLFIRQLGKVYGNEEQFLNFLDYAQNFSGEVINDPKTILNGVSKDYLLRLQENDFPVIPTKILGDKVTLEEAKNTEFNSNFYNESPEDFVLKPLNFGEMGASVVKLSSLNGKFDDFINQRSFIIQPYLQEILTKGESSFFYLGKKFAHAVHKFSGDFLINCYEGKTNYKIHNPSSKELGICENVLNSWPDKLGYSRVDFIYHDGQPLISEVEVVNPSNYVSNVPELETSFTPKLEKFLEERLYG